MCPLIDLLLRQAGLSRFPPAERAAFLDAAIGNEPALRDEVEALLAHDIDRRIVGHTVPRKWLDALATLVKETRP